MNAEGNSGGATNFNHPRCIRESWRQRLLANHRDAMVCGEFGEMLVSGNIRDDIDEIELLGAQHLFGIVVD